MPEKKIASLAVGILGLFVIIKSLPLIHAMIWQFISPQESNFIVRLYFLTVPLVTVLFSLFLIVFRKKLGSFLLGGKKNNQEMAYNSDQYHAVAISVVGLYFIVSGFAEFVGRVFPHFFQESAIESNIFEPSLFFLPSAIEFILGMSLFFGAHRIVSLWGASWFRPKGEWKERE